MLHPPAGVSPFKAKFSVEVLYASATACARSSVRAVLYHCCRAGANAGHGLGHDQWISARSNLSVRQFHLPHLRFGTGYDHDQRIFCRDKIWKSIGNDRGISGESSCGQAEFSDISGNGDGGEEQDHGHGKNRRNRVELSSLNFSYIQHAICKAIFHRDSLWSESYRRHGSCGIDWNASAADGE